MVTADWLNDFIHRPENIGWYCPDGVVRDFSPVLTSPDCLVVGFDGLCLMFHLRDGIATGHFCIDRPYRGKIAHQFCCIVMDRLFTDRVVDVIEGITPRSNRAAMRFTASLGFALHERFIDDHGRECAHWLMERERWADLRTEWARSSGASAAAS